MAIYTTRSGKTFDSGNIAYKKFKEILDEHMEMLIWAGEDEFPHLICVIDAESGHGLTVSVVETSEKGDHTPSNQVLAAS
jgi:hypothetical protein